MTDTATLDGGTPMPKTPTHYWADRKKRFKSIQVPRDLADMLLQVAQADDRSIADMIDLLMRGTIEARYTMVLEAKIEAMRGKTLTAKRKRSA